MFFDHLYFVRITCFCSFVCKKRCELRGGAENSLISVQFSLPHFIFSHWETLSRSGNATVNEGEVLKVDTGTDVVEVPAWLGK